MKGRYFSFVIFIGISLIAGCMYVVPSPPNYAMYENPSAWHMHYLNPDAKASYDSNTNQKQSSGIGTCKFCGTELRESGYPGEFSAPEDNAAGPGQYYDRRAQARAESVYTRRGWCIVPGFHMPWLPLDFSVHRPVPYVGINPESRFPEMFAKPR